MWPRSGTWPLETWAKSKTRNNKKERKMEAAWTNSASSRGFTLTHHRILFQVWQYYLPFCSFPALHLPLSTTYIRFLLHRGISLQTCQCHILFSKIIMYASSIYKANAEISKANGYLRKQRKNTTSECQSALAIISLQAPIPFTPSSLRRLWYEGEIYKE